MPSIYTCNSFEYCSALGFTIFSIFHYAYFIKLTDIQFIRFVKLSLSLFNFFKFLFDKRNANVWWVFIDKLTVSSFNFFIKLALNPALDPGSGLTTHHSRGYNFIATRAGNKSQNKSTNIFDYVDSIHINRYYIWYTVVHLSSFMS